MYSIVKTTENGSGWLIDNVIEDYDDAIVIARLYASEHAEFIGVDTVDTDDGAKFVTNNGTLVAYTVKEQ